MSMLDARRYRLLAAMGITPWRLRDAPVPADEASASASLQRWHIPLTADATSSVLEIAGAGLDDPPVQQLLTAMLAAIDLDLATASPAAETATVCAMLAFGDEAAAALTGSADGVSALRGQWHLAKASGVALLVTHHPATLLEQKSLKAEAWADLQMMQAHLRAAI